MFDRREIVGFDLYVDLGHDAFGITARGSNQWHARAFRRLVSLCELTLEVGDMFRRFVFNMNQCRRMPCELQAVCDDQGDWLQC